MARYLRRLLYTLATFSVLGLVGVAHIGFEALIGVGMDFALGPEKNSSMIVPVEFATDTTENARQVVYYPEMETAAISLADDRCNLEPKSKEKMRTLLARALAEKFPGKKGTISSQLMLFATFKKE